MTTQLQSRTSATATAPQETRDALAAAAYGLVDLGTVVAGIDPADRAMRDGLAALVADLETQSGASLGTTVGDPLVVLQRRFDRARRLLARGLRTS